MRCASLLNPHAVRRSWEGIPSFNGLNISHLDIPLVLSKDSTQQVTLHVAVTVSASTTDLPIDPTKYIPAEVVNPPVARGIATPASSETSRLPATLTPVPPLVQADAPMSSRDFVTGGPARVSNKIETRRNVVGPERRSSTLDREKTIDEIIATIER